MNTPLCAVCKKRPCICYDRRDTEDQKDSGMPTIRYIGVEFRDMTMVDAWDHSVRDHEDKYYSEPHLQQAIEDAVREERERCAKICYDADKSTHPTDLGDAILNAKPETDHE